MDFVPTLERARELGLSVVIDPPGLMKGPREVLAREPTRVVKQAAVIVIGSATRRSRTPMDNLILPGAAAALRPQNEEPPIDTPIDESGVSLLVSRGATERCDACGKRPGYQEHRACRGIGCSECNDTGEVTCSKCRGEGAWVRVRSIWVTEERLSFHNVYSPRDLPLTFDDVLQAMLGPPFVPPPEAEWRGELAKEQLGYRDSARDPRQVHGFSLVPALDTAMRFVEETCRGADRSEAHVFGWPILRLYYEGVGQAVIFTNPAGALEAHGWAAGAK